jgi:hypothetical protein
MSIKLGTGVRIEKLVIGRGKVQVTVNVDYLGNDLLHAGFTKGELFEVQGATLGITNTEGGSVQIEDFVFQAAKVVCDDIKRVAKVTLGGLEAVTWGTIRDFTRLMECSADPAFKLAVEWEYERQPELDLDGGKSVADMISEGIEKLRPKKGSGIDSVTISTADASATLEALDEEE